MSTELREALRRAANAVPPMGDAERAVRSGRRRRRAATVAAPLAVLAVVGGVWFVGAGSLGGDEPPVANPPPSEVTAADLAGRAFVTTGDVFEDTPLVLLFDTTELTVTTPDRGSTVVDYRIDEGVLVLEPAAYACGGHSCSIELLDLIHTRPTVSLAGDELTLSDAERAVTLTESDVAEADATLTGRTWGLQSISDGNEYLALPEGTQSTLEFGDGTISVDFGCNTGGGDVTVTDSTIEFGSISATESYGCADSPGLSTEQAIQRVLWADGSLAYVAEGDRLTITSDGGRLVYRAATTESNVGEIDARLTGRTWDLQSLPDGGPSFAVPGGFSSTLEFGDGTVTVDYGCNNGGGDETTTGSIIRIGKISTTQVGCAQPVLSVERMVQRVLWDNTLTITSTGGELVYRATS